MNAHKVNEFLEAPYLIDGNVKINYEERLIENKKVLLFEIEPSENYVIKTKDSKVYLRVGDKSKLLNHEQIIQLEYDKGERRFEDLVVEESTFEDVDTELLSKYKEILNTNLSLEEILEARALMKKGHLTYESAIPRIIEDIKREMHSQLRDFQYLAEDGMFKTIPEYPEFPWFEGIVNAITHRNYSLQGDCIRISLYDDHLEIFSPGKLPNIVTLENMKYTRYSRNPRIARVLTEFGYVKELNEGVKRIYDEMQESFLKDPIYTEPNSSSVLLTLENSIVSRKARIEENRNITFDPTTLPEKQLLVYGIISSHPGLNAKQISEILTLKKSSIETAIKGLKKKDIIEHTGSRAYGGYVVKK